MDPLEERRGLDGRVGLAERSWLSLRL